MSRPSGYAGPPERARIASAAGPVHHEDPMERNTLLIVDDEEAILKQLEWAFKQDFDVVTAASCESALSAVKEHRPGIMILDLSLSPGAARLEGFDVLESALGLIPTLKVIVITGHDERENALEAVGKGAYDFYAKPVVIEELRVLLRRASYLLSLEEELAALRRKGGEGHEFEGIIALSDRMISVFETVKRVAPADVAVLITGESGTGKELVASAVHRRSPRRGKPFVPINCGAIPENLLESELFGHEKGSFTGAHASCPGKFEVADGGSIFLDEIGELPQNLQVKLLRFLQDRMIERIGGRQPIKVDVRIMAATNRDLGAMIAERTFREDLFYRINTISIDLPPLRERGEDILLLAMHFLNRYNREYAKNLRGFGDAAQRALYRYPWPGNVRELENRVKRAVIMAPGKVIRPEDMDLPPADAPPDDPAAGASRPGDTASGSAAPGARTLREARDEVERTFVTRALLASAGNVSAAAQELGVSRPTLHDLMKKHGIDPDTFRSLKGGG
jgi:two-component system NtrC family response regulator